eukprot:g2991.t1
MSDYKPVVIDNGTGYTKMGYGGNVSPDYMVPSAIANKVMEKRHVRSNTSGTMEDLDFYIGDQAVSHSITHQINWPISSGQVRNWDNMEKIWHQCIFKYLRCDPENHYFLLTEPPMNSPENREYTAEVMFETFNVPGLSIAVQAVLALAAATELSDGSGGSGAPDLTGTVVDSGDGVTHVIPVIDGFVIGSCIKSMDLAGRDITNYIMKLQRDRGEDIPPEVAQQVARKTKETWSYTCPDILKEFDRYDRKPEKYFKHYHDVHPRTGKPFKVDVGYERFLGPEIFFNPEIFKSEYNAPLTDLIYDSILACPQDCRRRLTEKIVLSGGSTMFKDFGRRMVKDLKKKFQQRMDVNIALLKSRGIDVQPKPLVPYVVKYPLPEMQRYAVWLGGSLLSIRPGFTRMCKTKADYEEEGPRCMRQNVMFGGHS